MRTISLFLLLAFGLAYSVYLAFQGGIFMSLVISLISIGLTATFYVLSKRGNNRIIIYLWIAIVTIVVVAYISISVFQTAEIFRNPVKAYLAMSR